MAPSQIQGRVKLKHGRRTKQARSGPVKVGQGDIVNTRFYLYKSQRKDGIKNTGKVLRNRDI